MSLSRSRHGWVLGLAAAAAWLSCAHTPAEPPARAAFTLRLTAGERLNPDELGRSLPTAVQVLQLKSATKLESADVIGLMRDAKGLLGDALLSTDEVLLAPGADRELTITPEKEARFLAIVGIFRRPSATSWRELIELPSEGRAGPIELVVQDYRVERRARGEGP